MNTRPKIFKRAKILATVGPATHSYEKIEEMLVAGVNGFRLNFSHGNNEERLDQIKWIREASKKHKKPVAILQDLQGPKIRLGDFEGMINVTTGQELRLTFDGHYTEGGNEVPIQYDLSEKVNIGERLYLFDGRVRTTAIGLESKVVIVRVENDGFLLKRKGINLPDTDFGGDILTEKDLSDIKFGLTQDIDYVGLSFVQRASDIEKLREILVENNSDAMIISKIETQTAILEENLEGLVLASDAVMVARGDLAFETSPEIVPIVQRRILELCQKHGKISIVATQMLLSMVDNPEPTRAEVSDVANAVITGADCVMLSEESAMGKFPIETIATMKRVILYTQEHAPVRPLYVHNANHLSTPEAVSATAVSLAEQINATAIVAETKTGATAKSIAKHRPSKPIISVTSSPRVAQQLALLYANKSFLHPEGEKAGLELARELRETDFFDPSTTVVLVSGKQPGLSGGTDTIRVRVLE